MQTQTTPSTRRTFLKTSALAVGGLAAGCATPAARPLTAAERTRSIGANERIRIGQIGCGSRGVGAHMAGIHPHAQAQHVDEKLRSQQIDNANCNTDRPTGQQGLLRK